MIAILAVLDEMKAQDEEIKTTGGTDGGQMTHEDAMAQLRPSWIVKQSLRKSWRQRLDPRKEETYWIMESGPNECEKHCQWRKFTFTAMDVQISHMLRWGAIDIGRTYQTQKGHRVTVRRVQYFSTNIASPQASSAGLSEPTPQSTTHFEVTGAPTIGGGAITSSLSIASSTAAGRSRMRMQDAAVSFSSVFLCIYTSFTPPAFLCPPSFSLLR
jgi:hypothetical protein